MKILSCCPQGYYSRSASLSYEYVSFVTEPRRLGHTVHHFDYIQAARADRDAMNDFFLSLARTGGYDLILVMTHQDELLPEVLDEARRHTVTLAWNCDDDWRWDTYSSRWAPHFTYMATTYRHVFEANRERHPNLLLSQWGCTEEDSSLDTPKDLDISFVGACYGKRIEQVNRLRRELGLAAWGRGLKPEATCKHAIQKTVARAFHLPWLEPDLELPDQKAVKAVWNRSKISLTPLDASESGALQIKARVFDMGLSGSLMLCTRNPLLAEYYEPGKECVDFENLDECIDKARYYLSHESERAAIARRYADRTRAEHLWRHRYAQLLQAMDIKA